MFHRLASRGFLVVGALAVSAISNDADAQTPPPAINAPPPTLAGEFAFRSSDGNYLSVASGIGVVATPNARATEKFRLVRERGTANFRIQAPAGTYLTIANDTSSTPDNGFPVRAAYLGGTGTLFDLKFEQDHEGPRFGGYYTYQYVAILKDAPNFRLARNWNTTGPKPTVAAHNVGTVKSPWSITKCGDLGNMQAYALRPVGTKGASGAITLARQSDGSYAVQVGAKYWTAVKGGGNAPGKGSDGWPIDTADKVGAFERFKFLDQGNCTYAIQTAKGWHLGMKAGQWDWDLLSTRISDPNAAPSIGYVAYFELVPTQL